MVSSIRVIVVAGLLSLLVALFGLSAWSQDSQTGRLATPWRGPTGITVTMEELRRGAPPTEVARVQPRHDDRDDESERTPATGDRARPNTRATSPAYEFQGILPRAQPVTLSFTAFVGNGAPDPMGAVGPRQFLLVINQRIKTFDKRTGQHDGVIDLALGTFFRPAGNSPFDPNVRYDRRADKWIVGAINTFGSNNGSNRLMFAVSDTGVLSSATRWTFFWFQFDQAEPAGNTGCSADLPSWGHDAATLYVTVATTSCADGSRPGLALFVVQKASLYGSGPLMVSAFRNLSSLGSPVDDLESGGGTGYFVTDRQLCRVVDAGTLPRLLPCTALAGTDLFSTFTDAVRHRGNSEESGTATANLPNSASTISGRLAQPTNSVKAGMLRRGHLWFARAFAVDNTGQLYFADEVTRVSRLGLVWFDIVDIDSASPRVAQSGRVFQPSAGNDVHQRNYWMPSLAVSGQGHILIGASAAGSNEYVNAVAVGRLASDPPGMFRDPELYTDASAAFNAPERFGGTGLRRWGDYTFTSVDPCDDMTMWTIQQYTAEADKWGVAVARVMAPPPVTPDNASPNVVAAGQDGVEVQLRGTSTNGSGFFDPGPGFECRLRVDIPGASVNTIRVIDSTTLSINLSTRGALASPLNVTITNPDGQSTVASNLIRVQ